MSQLPNYIAVFASVIAIIMSAVAAYLSYKTKRSLDENVLQARNRELPPSANTAEPESADATIDTGEPDE